VQRSTAQEIAPCHGALRTNTQQDLWPVQATAKRFGRRRSGHALFGAGKVGYSVPMPLKVVSCSISEIARVHLTHQYFFLCLAGSLAAFLAPSIIDELTSTIDELFGRRQKPPVVEPRRSNEKAVDPPSPPKHLPSPPKKYLENVKPLDGLQRDCPRPTEASKPAAERFSRLCESIEDLSPKEQTGRLREHFGIFGGTRPAEGQGRKGKRP
jgi:hypothetical protein